jgi:hypothetical protein
MTNEWRTVQMFLSDDGVHEVQTDVDDYAKMMCTCAVFKSSKKCKHTRYVKRRIDLNGGSYAIRIPDDVSDNEVDEAMMSADAFRSFVIHHAKVEFLK